MLGQMIFAMVFILAVVASARGQTPPPKPSVSTKQLHWHMYVNRSYGLSFWYPDMYRPIPPPDAEGRCTDRDVYKCLLLLERRDSADGRIWVGITVTPFHLYPGSGDVMASRQPIGRHVFYGGVGGSMGVGFTDFYDMNLKGKTLMFVFGPNPDDPVNPSSVSKETRQLEPRILKSLRTF